MAGSLPHSCPAAGLTLGVILLLHERMTKWNCFESLASATPSTLWDAKDGGRGRKPQCIFLPKWLRYVPILDDCGVLAPRYGVPVLPLVSQCLLHSFDINFKDLERVFSLRLSRRLQDQFLTLTPLHSFADD
ncbi:hypothetical protein V8E51_004340 [Hyaloscypha variabilis]|jgi:hypothetical protein|uniref:Uncharacterized protein n=1 Tax=Hyaloscypha variabilis (strain UAMH 11265 / GT02V1 / F) TaxID=1149755 RepID=A0A2J6R6H8_HYAVF|nr:hypothetical protein L207DRAFT_135686 [Hyaloscypha variabilis F]